MSRDDYVQHGHRRHRRGTDPILEGVDVEWALVKGDVSAAGPAQTYIDLSSFSAYKGNDETGLYSLNLGTGGLSAIHGIAIHDSGVYRAWWAYDFVATAGETLVGNYAGELGVSASWVFQNGQGLDDRVVIDSTHFRVRFARMIFVDGPIWTGPAPTFPRTTFPSATVSSGTHTFDAEVSILIERMSAEYTTNLAAGAVP